MPAANRLLEAAYGRLEPEPKADTVVLVTVCQGMPEIFDEKATPPGQRVRLVKGLKAAGYTPQEAKAPGSAEDDAGAAAGAASPPRRSTPAREGSCPNCSTSTVELFNIYR